jgi:acylphosphatase
MNKRYHIFFSGTVQGVGFRYTARALASRYSLNGWAKNLSDGRVELEIEGPENDLGSFLQDLKEEFKEYLKDTQLQELPASGAYDDFRIRS